MRSSSQRDAGTDRPMSEGHVDGVELVPPGPDRPHTSPSNMLRTRVIPLIVLALLVSLIGVLAYALFAPESARPETRGNVNGAIVFNDARQAFDFTLTTLDGSEQVSLEDFRGKVVVLNFWASWCDPCIEEMPMLVQASREYGDEVVFLGINVWDTEEDAIAFSERLGITYPVLDFESSEDGEVDVEYGVVGVPETYIVGPNGALVALYRGPFQNIQDLREIVALAQ
jgi:thiol-disulfide isomerase/thioredoxin